MQRYSSCWNKSDKDSAFRNWNSLSTKELTGEVFWWKLTPVVPGPNVGTWNDFDVKQLSTNTKKIHFTSLNSNRLLVVLFCFFACAELCTRNFFLSVKNAGRKEHAMCDIARSARRHGADNFFWPLNILFCVHVVHTTAKKHFTLWKGLEPCKMYENEKRNCKTCKTPVFKGRLWPSVYAVVRQS